MPESTILKTIFAASIPARIPFCLALITNSSSPNPAAAPSTALLLPLPKSICSSCVISSLSFFWSIKLNILNNSLEGPFLSASFLNLSNSSSVTSLFTLIKSIIAETVAGSISVSSSDAPEGCKIILGRFPKISASVIKCTTSSRRISVSSSA